MVSVSCPTTAPEDHFADCTQCSSMQPSSARWITTGTTAAGIRTNVLTAAHFIYNIVVSELSLLHDLCTTGIRQCSLFCESSNLWRATQSACAHYLHTANQGYSQLTCSQWLPPVADPQTASHTGGNQTAAHAAYHCDLSSYIPGSEALLLSI